MRDVEVFDLLPDSLVVEILSRLADAQHVQQAAACSRRFRELAKQVKVLNFNGDQIPEPSEGHAFEEAISQMLSRAATGSLRHLTVRRKEGTGQFTDASVLGWIAPHQASLRYLEVNDSDETADLNERLKAAACCPLVEVLKLWGSGKPILDASISACTGAFQKLRWLDLLEISTSAESLTQLLSGCPRLTHFSAQGLSGVNDVSLESSTLKELTLRVSNNWWNEIPDRFSTLCLKMPCLEFLELSDIQHSLTVENAPLRKLKLDNTPEIFYELGNKLQLDDLDIETDMWPCFGEIRTKWSWNYFRAFLQKSDPTLLQSLTLPHVDCTVQFEWTSAREVFKKLTQLKFLSLPASVLHACQISEEGVVAQVLEGLCFDNLNRMFFYLDDVASGGVLEFLIRMVTYSPKLATSRISANSGLDGQLIPGHFLFELFKLQRSKPAINIVLELPNHLMAHSN